MLFALGKGAERASVRAHVCVVDVAIDDVADDVAADRLTKLIGGGYNAAIIGVARREQPHDLRRVQTGARLSALDDPLERWVDGARMDSGHAWSDFRSGRPIVVTREALGVTETPRLRGDLRRGPGRKIAQVGGIDRQAVPHRLAGGGRTLGKLGGRRPWRLGIHVIRGDGGNPAPIIDPRRNQSRIDARRQVGRRLDVHLSTQDKPRGGEAPKQVVKIGFHGSGELRAVLGAEVLDDDFLNVPELPMQIADGEERLEALGARLADADENAGRERHAQLARQSQRFKTSLGLVVRRAIMHAAWFAEPRAERFQHDSLAGGDRTQAGELRAVHHAGICVRQQSGLAQHERAHRLEIVDCGSVPERVEGLPGGAVAHLRLIAEREERLRAAGGRPGARYRDHLLCRKIGAPSCAWPLGESAVMTDVPAEMGERNEPLARVRKMTAMSLIAQTARGVDQLRERRLFQPDRKRLVARIAHSTTFESGWRASALYLEADDE